VNHSKMNLDQLRIACAMGAGWTVDQTTNDVGEDITCVLSPDGQVADWGWGHVPIEEISGKLPPYATDETAAFTLLAHLKANGDWYPTLQHLWTGHWVCDLYRKSGIKGQAAIAPLFVAGNGATACEAIMHAFMEAKGCEYPR